MQITSASGFGYSVVAELAENKQATEMIQDFCQDNFNQFSMISYAGDLPKLRAGEVLESIVAPEDSFELRPLEANGPTHFDDASISKICVQMCAPLQFGWKLDTELNIGYDDKIMQIFGQKLENTMNSVNKMFVRYIVNKLITGASSFNSGNTAGKSSGSIKMGTANAPLKIVTPASGANLNNVADTIHLQWNNILQAVTRAATEQECDISNFRMIAHPDVNNYLQLATRMGGCCDNVYTLNGFTLASKYFGYSAMFSNQVPIYRTAPNKFITPIIFASPKATMFHGGISRFYSDEELWMQKFVSVVTYGGKVIRPNQVYVVWVEFTDENIA